MCHLSHLISLARTLQFTHIHLISFFHTRHLYTCSNSPFPHLLMQHVISLTHASHTPHLSRTNTPVHINAVGFMQQHFKDLLDNKKYVDVTFVVEGQPMPAHRLILASQSDYFDLLFYGKMREANSSDEMPLPNAPLEALRVLLEFMYSGCLDYDNQPLQVSVVCHVDW